MGSLRRHRAHRRRGAWGGVSGARDTKLDRDVALKVLPAERMRRCGHSPNLEPDVNRGTRR